MHGLCDVALAMFEDMARAMVEPDGVTFVAVLSACSHTGRVAEGRRLFNQMVREHKISPSMKHFTCMVDLLGRAGLLKDASELIETMPMRPDLCVWGALLNSCRMHGNAGMAEATIAKVLQAETETTGNHMLITNLYATCGMWDDSKRVRVMTKEAGLRKNPGQSWIEVKNKVFAFTAGNTPLPEAAEIFRVLDDLYGEMEDEKQGRVMPLQPSYRTIAITRLLEIIKQVTHLIQKANLTELLKSFDYQAPAAAKDVVVRRRAAGFCRSPTAPPLRRCRSPRRPAAWSPAG